MGIFWIITSVVLGAAGQICLKTGMLKIGQLDRETGFTGILLYLIKAVFSPFVFLGLAAYGVSMLIWLWVLSKYELSYARPFASLGYIIIAFYSYFVFGEHLDLPRWIGISLIIGGVVLLTKS